VPRFFQKLSKGLGKVLDPTGLTNKAAAAAEPYLQNPAKYGKDKKRALGAAKNLADAKAERDAEHTRLIGAKDGLTMQLSELRAGRDPSKPANADRTSLLRYVRK